MSALTPVSIEIVSDIVCPWCYIGTAHLEAALRARPEITATVRYLPFLLDPATPDAGADLRARLKAKYGGDPEAMFARVESVGRAAGLTLDFRKVRRACATVRAHTLLVHAEARGTQRALAHALFAAYFTEGRDVGDVSVLVSIAAEHGFAEDECRALVTDASALQATRDAAEGLRREGITGVPFFVFDEKLAMSGAQPVATMLEALDRCAAEAGGAG